MNSFTHNYTGFSACCDIMETDEQCRSTTEAHPNSKDWILTVIDQLRQRKARPDLERICHFVERKHGIKRAETEADLERLVDTGAVIKVVYKRGTSYRNAAKSRKKSYSANVLNSSSLSHRIIEAVGELCHDKGTVDEIEDGESPHNGVEGTGASLTDIENWLADRAGEFDSEPLGCPMRLVLQREVDARRLRQLPNGEFVLSDEFQDESIDTGESLKQRAAMSAIVSKRGRPPKRKVIIGRDLSIDVPSAPAPEVAATRTAAPPATNPAPAIQLCDFCQQTRNRRGLHEKLLRCKDCSAKAHPSCMNYSAQLARRARMTPWQCIDCKTCCFCFDSGDADAMLFCDACDKGYHMTCHDPRVDEKPIGKWVCHDCVMDGVEVDDSEGSNIVDSTVASTDLNNDSHSRNKLSPDKDEPYKRVNVCPPPVKKPKDDVYPDASSWTVADVTNFFIQKGFKEQANSFEEQEIDGQSLLLLKRSDVLQSLSLKLGPALKIYNHVMQLQTVCETKL